MRSVRLLLVVFILLSTLTAENSALAIEGGKTALGENVVTFVLKNPQTGNVSPPYCSGGLIAPRIAVTAKHCVANPNSASPGKLNSEWEVTFPGIDLQLPNFDTAKILSIIMNPGDFSSTDDIALVILDREFPVPNNLKVATPDDMIQLRNAQAPSFTYGYGANSVTFAQSLVPLKIENILLKDFFDRSWGPEVFAIKYLREDSYICGGDSGGPNYISFGDYIYFIGPTGFATRPGCAKGLVGSFQSGGTAIAYKFNLIRDAESTLERFKSEELKAAAEKAAAEKAAAEKAAAEKAAAEKAAARIKRTIICVKNKLSKKVYGVNPRCPLGYKLK